MSVHRLHQDFLDACKNGNLSLIQKFVQVDGVDANAIVDSSNGMVTPLHIALDRKFFELARYLLQVGGEHAVQAKDERRWTPLFYVCSSSGAGSLGARTTGFGNQEENNRFVLEMAILLIEKYGANVNATDDDGRTPLHEASEAGNVDLCELLILKGAKKCVRDADGLSPFDLALARQRKHNQSAKLLRLLSSPSSSSSASPRKQVAATDNVEVAAPSFATKYVEKTIVGF